MKKGLFLLIFVSGFAALDAQASNALDAGISWYAARSPEAESNWLWGDTGCQWGEPDCNVCANDVKGFFDEFFASESNQDWDSRKWFFDWDHTYPPENIDPSDSFERGINGGHIQGFVRTNSSTVKYVGTHSVKPGESDDGLGSIFFTQKRDGENKLIHIQESDADNLHPSGVHVLGKYIVLAEDVKDTHTDEVRIFDVERAHTIQNTAFELPDLRRGGGGIGITKLGDVGYLIVATSPGGDGTTVTAHKNNFYYIEGSLTDPTRTVFLGSSPFDRGASIPYSFAGMTHVYDSYRYSENLSLITECGTGDIYSVHTSSVGGGMWADEGYWRLSKLQWDADGPYLKTLKAYVQDQSSSNCDLRSAGTVHVKSSHELELVCHQTKEHDDHASSKDDFIFKVGTLVD